MQQVRIQVAFQEKTKYGEYNDALYFSPEDYEAKTTEQITSLIEERVDNYVDKIENAPEPTEPTKEELQSEQKSLQSRLEEVNEKLEELPD